MLVGVAAATSASAAIFTYNAAAFARVHVHAVKGVEVSPAQLKDTPEVSAFQRVAARGASTTFLSRNIATEAAGDGARFVVDSAGNATLRAQGPTGWLEVSEHAAERMTQRGISIDALDSTLTQQPFQYWHEGVWKTGYYDPLTKIFAGTVDDTVTTVIGKATQNYINNLKAVTPP